MQDAKEVILDQHAWNILTAFLLIALVFTIIFLGHLWLLTLFAALVAELAAYEYLQFANLSGAKSPSGEWPPRPR